MRKNKTRLIRFSVLALCLTLLMFGVYAVSKSATLTTSGTVGFNAHDCTLTMYGTITGAVSNIDNMLAEPNEVFYFGNEENQLEIKDTTVYSFAENLTDATLTTKYPIIYFNDAGNTVPPIVMTYHFTNTSAYTVSAEVESLISYEGTTATVTSPIENIGVGETATMVITITLDDVNSEIPTDTTNFSLSMNFAKQAYSTGFNYTANTRDGEIVSYNVSGIGTCTDEVLKIAPTYNGKPVVGIGDRAFYGIENIKKVIIPEGVTTLGQYSFYSCYNMEYIHIPSTVTTIDSNAFYYCDNLKDVNITDLDKWLEVDLVDITSSPFYYSDANLSVDNKLGTSVTYPEGCTSTKKYTFTGCASLKEIVIPNSMVTIEKGTFANCKNLKSANIPEGVETLKEGVFSRCTSLSEVTLPSTLTTMGPNVFYSCSSLASIDLPENLVEIGYDSFSQCAMLESVEIPEGVKILNGVFKKCTNLKNVKLPSSLETLYSTFYGCTSLVSIEIPEGVTKIFEGTFGGCTALKNVKLPSTLLTIGTDSEYDISADFYNCTSLEYIEIPDSVTSLGKYTFNGCTGLKGIKFSTSMNKILKTTFTNCTSLEWAIIPTSVTSINSQTFYNVADNFKLFYTGSESEFSSSNLVAGNFTNGEVYYYTETAPTEAGNYWHYVTDDTTGEQVPTVWEIV